MAKVSVVIPSFNHHKYLEQRISSVFAQTYKDFECIIIDDASTDGSQEILKRYEGHPNLKLVFNAANSGNPFVQWNSGIRMAQGEYVWVAESDDFTSPTFLEKLVALLDAHPNLGFACCQSWVVNESGDKIYLWTKQPGLFISDRWSADFVACGAEESVRFLYCGNTIPNASAVLFRRDLYNQIGGADERLYYAGDFLLWTMMLKRFDMAYCAEPLNYFRCIHLGSQRFRAVRERPPIEELARVYDYILENFPCSPADQDAAKDRLAETWLKHTLRMVLACTPLRLDRGSYNFLRDYDERLTRRLFKLFLKLTARRLRIPAW